METQVLDLVQHLGCLFVGQGPVQVSRQFLEGGPVHQYVPVAKNRGEDFVEYQPSQGCLQPLVVFGSGYVPYQDTGLKMNQLGSMSDPSLVEIEELLAFAYSPVAFFRQVIAAHHHVQRWGYQRVTRGG